MNPNPRLSYFSFLLFLLIFACAHTAVAEDSDYSDDSSDNSTFDNPQEPSYEKTTRQRKRRKQRRRKKRRPSNTITEQATESSHQNPVRLSLLTGYSQAGSPSALVEAALTAGSLSQSIVTGLDFSAPFSSHFGMDFEGFYAFSVPSNSTGDLATTGESGLSPFGVVLGVFGTLPFRTPSTTLSPYLGVTAGGFGLRLSRTSNGTTNSGIGGSYGLGVLLGIKLQVVESVEIFADYSIPALMYGQGQLGSIVFDDTSYDRLRISLQFPVGPAIALGAQYIQRNFRFRTALSNLNATTLISASQFIAFIEFRL